MFKYGHHLLAERSNFPGVQQKSFLLLLLMFEKHNVLHFFTIFQFLALLYLKTFLILDFDPDSMAKVLELISTGSTKLRKADETVYQGMLDIIQCLQINIKLKEKTFSDSSTKKPPGPIEVALTSSRPYVLEEMPQRKERYMKKPEIKKTGKDDVKIKDMKLKNHDWRHKTMTKTQSIEVPQQNNEQEFSEQDTSLTADIAVPIDIEDEEIMNNFYFCPFCDETFDDFELFNLHTKAHSDDNCSPENQNDVSNKGKEGSF